MATPADFDLADDGSAGRRLRFEGRLTMAELGDMPNRLANLDGRISTIDMSRVERLDTSGAWIAYRTARDHDAEITGLDGDYQRLFDAVKAADAQGDVRPDRLPVYTRVLERTGEAVVNSGHGTVTMVGFLGAILRSIASLAAHPRRLRWNAISRQMELVGVASLGIVGLMSFLIGIVIAQQGAVQLRQFGAEVFTINLVGRLTFRELGVLMTAIMVAGRSGSAFAAQIGTMRLTEEVDAMRTIGVSPYEALIAPRMFAAIFMMFVLGFYASMVTILGGGFLSWLYLDIPPATFVQRIREVVPVTDVLIGLIKAPVFGAIIAWCGCYQGMRVEGNAEEVGLRTTNAVVQAIFMVIVVDAFFAVFFTWIGWN